MEEIYIVDDLTTGTIKVVRNLKDLKAGSFIVSHKIVGRNLEVEVWGTSANEILLGGKNGRIQS